MAGQVVHSLEAIAVAEVLVVVVTKSAFAFHHVAAIDLVLKRFAGFEHAFFAFEVDLALFLEPG